MNLNDHDRRRFAEDGLLYLKRLLPKSRTRSAKESILAELTRLGARQSGKWHSSKIPRQIRHQPAFDDVIPKDLLSLLNDLAGRKLLPQPQPQILLTPPQKLTWSVPHLGWHLDVKAPSRDEIPGIQVFVLLDDVARQGGGTVAITGSHKLHGPQSAHQVLQTDPVYTALFAPDTADRAKFMKPIPVGEAMVQVVEMCGEAGDVYLMDMRVLHAPAINGTKTMRMMLTNRYLSQR